MLILSLKVDSAGLIAPPASVFARHDKQDKIFKESKIFLNAIAYINERICIARHTKIARMNLPSAFSTGNNELSSSQELWVFGYGSLMWNPGFTFSECHVGRLRGYHRALCVYSHVHRGTPERPGLVLGLDRGGTCRGHVFCVPGQHVQSTIEYLRAREQVTSVYLEKRFAVLLDDGSRVSALTYVVDRSHRQYAGRLPSETILQHVQHGEGQSGRNPDYVLATHDHLVTLGIMDPVLSRLALRLRPT